MTRIVAICPTVGIATSAAAFKYEKKKHFKRGFISFVCKGNLSSIPSD